MFSKRTALYAGLPTTGCRYLVSVVPEAVRVFYYTVIIIDHGEDCCNNPRVFTHTITTTMGFA